MKQEFESKRVRGGGRGRWIACGYVLAAAASGCSLAPTEVDEEAPGTTRQALIVPDPPAAGCISRTLVSPEQLFVSPSGDDANDGTTVGAPLATLAGAHARMVALTVGSDLTSDWLINVRGGTYRGQHVKWFKTSPTHRIHIKAYQNETPIFDGILAGETHSRRSRFFDLDVPTKQATNITIDGLTIQNYVHHGIRLGVSTLPTASCNVITNNHLWNIGSSNGYCPGRTNIDNFSCVRGSNPADDSCDCNDPAGPCACQGYGALDLTGSSKNVLARNTLVDLVNIADRNINLIHAVYAAHSSNDNLIQENYVRNVSGAAFKIRNSSNNNSFISNYVERAGSTAFVGDQAAASTGNLLKDNLFTFGYDGTPVTLGATSSYVVDSAQATSSYLQGTYLQAGQATKEVVSASTTADIDGDGAPETFVALYYPDLGFTKVVYSAGRELMLSRVAYSSASWRVTAMTAGDFDGTGAPEVITAFSNTSGTKTQVHVGALSAGSYSLVGGGKLLDSSGSGVIRVSAMTSGVFGGTQPKLYSAISSSGVQQIVRGDGVTTQSGSSTPGFSDGTVVYSSSSWEIPALATGKIDGTGNLKLISAFHWIGGGSAKNRIYLGDATATNGATNGGMIFDNSAQQVRALATGKFDGANERLISAFDDAGTARLYLSNSASLAQGTSLYSSGSWAITALAAGNVNVNSAGDEIVTSFDNDAQTQVHVADGTSSATNLGALYTSL